MSQDYRFAEFFGRWNVPDHSYAKLPPLNTPNISRHILCFFTTHNFALSQFLKMCWWIVARRNTSAKKVCVRGKKKAKITEVTTFYTFGVSVHFFFQWGVFIYLFIYFCGREFDLRNIIFFFFFFCIHRYFYKNVFYNDFFMMILDAETKLRYPAEKITLKRTLSLSLSLSLSLRLLLQHPSLFS